MKIRAKGGLYPLIHDTPPSIPGGYIPGVDCESSYHGIGLRIPYTGTMRIAAEPIPNYFSPGFCAEDWMYRRVLDLTFADGHLRSVTDISEEIDKTREENMPHSLKTMLEIGRRFAESRKKAAEKKRKPK